MTLPAENIARLGLNRVSRVLPTAVAGGLAAKLTAAFVILVTAVLAFNGAINMALSYKEATTAAIEVQKEKAQAAAERVLQFVEGIEGQMGWTTRTEWARVSLEQRRYDFIRLLRQTPAITELYQIDGAGKEQLRLSRLEPDMIGSGVDYSQDPRFTEAVANKVWYGPVYFRRGSEPYMTLSIAHSGRNPGVTSAGVNLKLVWDVITSIRVGEAGYAYVTDAKGKLVAHPDMSLVLRGTELGHLPEVALAATGTGGSRGSAEPVQVTGLDGRSVLRAHAVIPKLGWIVFVELPIRETMAPVWTSFYQTMALLVFGVLIAAILGAWLAGRTVGPIKKLQAGAERLGKGDLSQRVMVESKDEIGTLAQRFNAMAERIQDAQETLEANVAARTRELSQSLEGLRAAQDRLVQSEKLASLGQLTAGIAHEIKNPLNFVNNFADLSGELVVELEEVAAKAGLALDPNIREEIAELAAMLKGNLAKVVQHGRRADSIVKNMLLHSREGGGELRPIDLNAAAEEALNLAYHGARAEKPGFNITLEKDLDPAVGTVEVYPQEFTRVLLNLIGNGFHAAYKKKLDGADDDFEPTLRLSTKAAGDSVTVTIRDNGAGIPEAVKARIFEPFFTTKPAGEGTGLGLSLSHDIVVKQHGGAIDIETQPGEFTAFKVTVPRNQNSGRAA